MARQTKSVEATTRMPWTSLSREECRLVSCPYCGAESATECLWPNKNDPSVFRRRTRIHRSRIDKAIEYRQEHRI